MSAVTFTASAAFGNISPSISATTNGGGVVSQSPDTALPVAQAGTLTTRTSNTAGVVTLAATPNVDDGDTVTLSWGTNSFRHGCDVTAVSGNLVTVSGGIGDALPAADTAIKVSKEVVLDVDIPGDRLQVLVLSASANTYMAFDETTGTTTPIDEYNCPAGGGYFWYTGSQYTNPFVGVTIGAVLVANLDTASESTVSLGAHYKNPGE